MGACKELAISITLGNGCFHPRVHGGRFLPCPALLPSQPGHRSGPLTAGAAWASETLSHAKPGKEPCAAGVSSTAIRRAIKLPAVTN